MGERVLVSLLLVFNCLLAAVADTDNKDLTALQSLNWQNTPASWVGSDPCAGWDGIECTDGRVTSISLPSMGLEGQLSEEIGALSELTKLDLSYNKDFTGSLPQAIGNLRKLTSLWLVGCGFSGPIPDEIGSLQELVYLSLNSNSFSGQIPPSIGNLSKLFWLDLAHNQLSGTIPISSSDSSGLDQLYNTNHFHLGENKLSGRIPPALFSPKMTMIHMLLHGNQLTEGIPATLGLVQSLQVVRFDNNSLTGQVPQNINNLTKLQELYLCNNKLSGPQPDLAGMNNLFYLDMSNNEFDPLDFESGFSSLQALTTLKMESTRLQGPIPDSFFSLANLQNVMLKGNDLNGTLDLGTTTTHGSKLQLIDLQMNNIVDFEQKDEVLAHITIKLKNNPICLENGEENKYYCKDPTSGPQDTTPSSKCQHATCSADQIPSPTCICAYPFTGTLVFRTPSFLDWGSKTVLEETLEENFDSDKIPVDAVVLLRNLHDDQSWKLQVFPPGQEHFSRREISRISFILGNNDTGNAFDFYPDDRGPYAKYTDEPMGSNKPPDTGIIIGATVGGSVLLVLLIIAGVYAFRQKKRAEKAIEQNNPFVQLDPNDSRSSMLQFKGARRFSFEELRKYTKNFSPENDIGCGGFGKVYKGTLPSGQLVAIKRAQKESIQGGLQFRAEIELLSRVHHKNLVGLVGFCFERGEQMLVYEFIPNGTLKDTISGKSGIILDWIRRLKVAVGAARGLAYLHDHANPPIIHRDIKSNNILLDERLNAKVADFGLSKPMDDCDKSHITTQVRGTMGYLDPEYYTSQQLTEKTDVYSFGVLMLELVTARKPIEKGKYIVKVVRNAIDKTKELYGLHEVLDPTIGLGFKLDGFEKFVDLAMRCLEETGANRPTMSEVVKEIENILESAGLNPAAESAPSTSASFEELSKGSANFTQSNESFDSDAVLPPQTIQPK